MEILSLNSFWCCYEDYEAEHVHCKISDADQYCLDIINLWVVMFAESPRSNTSTGDDWRSAFDAAANGSVDYRRSGSNGHSRHEAAQNGDVNSRSGSNSRRTPTRLPPAAPQSISTGYKY